jgi:hypothetical protein
MKYFNIAKLAYTSFGVRDVIKSVVKSTDNPYDDQLLKVLDIAFGYDKKAK